MTLVVQLKFKLTNYNVVVQYIIPYAIGTVRKADIGFVSCPMFHWLGLAGHKLVLVSLCLGDRPSLIGYWKFNTFLVEILTDWKTL